MGYLSPDYGKYSIKDTNFSGRNEAADRIAYLQQQGAKAKAAALASGETYTESKELKAWREEAAEAQIAEGSNSRDELEAMIRDHHKNKPKKKPGLLNGLKEKLSGKKK
jgi:hypothetical protein